MIPGHLWVEAEEQGLCRDRVFGRWDVAGSSLHFDLLFIAIMETVWASLIHISTLRKCVPWEQGTQR